MFLRLLLLVPLLLPFFSSAQSPSFSVETLAKGEQRRFASLRNYDLQSMSSNNFDVQFYHCQWTVDPAVRAIAGSITSYFTITSTTSNITFDLYNNLIVDSVRYGGASVSFSRNLDALQINFPAPLSAGKKDSVQIFYHGVPTAGQGYFETGTHNGSPILWTLSEPYGARAWWPCKDVLADKPDSIEIIITHPAGYISSSNGLPLFDAFSGTQRTTRWKHNYPIAPYLVAIAVTNYVVANDSVLLAGKNMPVTLYAYPEALANFLPATATAKFCLQNFSPLISPYPFLKERYAQTQFPYGGGMEHQTNSFIGAPNAGLVAHELAHQWFGDKVTCASWSDLWLNEGFASYMEFVYVELSNAAAKKTFLQNWRNSITSLPGGSVFVEDTLNFNRLFDSRLTYRKGGYLLHMLRWKLGDSTFFKGVRRYLNDPLLAYKNARSADLQRNLEAESGQNLTEFFKDWLYGEGYPSYNAEWSAGNGSSVTVKLGQTTSHPSVGFFEMPVPLQFKGATRDTIITVNPTKNNQLFTVNPGFLPDTLIVDPELRILSKNNTSKKVAALSSADGFLLYPNPVRGNLTISFAPAQNTSITIYTAGGQQVYKSAQAATASEVQIATSGWAAGVYWVHLWQAGKKEVKQLLVLKN